MYSVQTYVYSVQVQYVGCVGQGTYMYTGTLIQYTLILYVQEYMYTGTFMVLVLIDGTRLCTIVYNCAGLCIGVG